MDNECKHGMVPAFCAECRGLTLEDKKTDANALKHRKMFSAKYPGKCSDCGDPYKKGELVSAEIDESNPYSKWNEFLCGECTENL